jgi:hypothetical protein
VGKGNQFHSDIHKVLRQQTYPGIGRKSKFNIFSELILQADYQKSTHKEMIAAAQRDIGDTCIGLSTDETICYWYIHCPPNSWKTGSEETFRTPYKFSGTQHN